MRPIHAPVITEDDLGPVGWRAIHDLARQRHRPPRQLIIPLVQGAIARWLAGEEVEPSRSQLESLFGKSLESVA